MLLKPHLHLQHLTVTHGRGEHLSDNKILANKPKTVLMSCIYDIFILPFCPHEASRLAHNNNNYHFDLYPALSHGIREWHNIFFYLFLFSFSSSSEAVGVSWWGRRQSSLESTACVGYNSRFRLAGLPPLPPQRSWCLLREGKNNICSLDRLWQ